MNQLKWGLVTADNGQVLIASSASNSEKSYCFLLDWWWICKTDRKINFFVDIQLILGKLNYSFFGRCGTDMLVSCRDGTSPPRFLIYLEIVFLNLRLAFDRSPVASLTAHPVFPFWFILFHSPSDFPLYEPPSPFIFLLFASSTYNLSAWSLSNLNVNWKTSLGLVYVKVGVICKYIFVF